jgi:transaldolase
VADLHIDIFADSADLATMLTLARTTTVRGFTTNPTLMRKAGVRDYRQFARALVAAIPDRPISFEVIADKFDDMEAQAREIAGWGDLLYVKIPVTNTRGEPSAELIHRLSHSGVQVNVTAVMSLRQVEEVAGTLAGGAPAIVSVFAGRIADTGRDPVPLVCQAVRVLTAVPLARVLWASPRELLNVFQAEQAGCHIITVTPDILAKLPLIGVDLERLSLDTVRMFRNDAVAAGLALVHSGDPT